MERQKFEDSFKEAFQHAEVNPSEHVWTNIELDLERLESGKMKRRLLFFKLVAAASVVFAMAIGGTGYIVYQNTQDNSNPSQLANNTNTEQAPSESTGSAKDALTQELDNASESSGDTQAIADRPTDNPDAEQNTSASPAIHNAIASSSSSVLSSSSDKTKSSNSSQVLSEQAGEPSFTHDNNGDDREINQKTHIAVHDDDRASSDSKNSAQPEEAGGNALLAHEDNIMLAKRDRLPALVSFRKPAMVTMPEPDKLSEVELLLARLAHEKKMEEQAVKERRDERLWTSVGFSAGTFNNANASGPAIARAPTVGRLNNYSVATNTLSNESSASGQAYSVGISVGGKLSDRWVVQGGLSYLQQNSNFTSDAVVTADHLNFSAPSSAFVNEASTFNQDQSVIPTAPYNVNNNIQFISLPVQVGFIVINKGLGLQLNGGVSTDMFIQNTVTPTQGTLSKATYGRGDDSPYRPVNFSGLLGTELSYRFADRYRIALNPGLRYPFSSIYKSDTGLEAVPVTFDVGLKFRYIFQ